MNTTPRRTGAPASIDQEAVLLRSIADRDRHAFETLYRIYYRRLTRFLERMLRHPHLIEEVLNDTMFTVWRKADSYNHSSRVSTWIFGIAYKKGLKALRFIAHAANDAAQDEVVCTRNGPETEMILNEIGVRLKRALSTLSPEQRAVVELTYYDGYDYREIAEIIGCPIDTVKTRMFYARRKLKTLLAATDQ